MPLDTRTCHCNTTPTHVLWNGPPEVQDSIVHSIEGAYRKQDGLEQIPRLSYKWLLRCQIVLEGLR